MVNLVIVSHSASLAEGVVELAREMGGAEVAIAAAGGLEDGSIGTDAERVAAAVTSVRSADGVLVLMDLGSALMSAEIALELIDPDGGPVRMTAAPLVEGAVAAAARARGGASLDEVAGEARGALAAKASQLEEDEGGSPEAAAVGADASSEVLPVTNRLGLHVRPAGRIIALVADHDATVELRNPTRGTGPTDGRSLTGLAMLRVRHGDELSVAATGTGASALLDALRALAADNWGDPREAAAGEDAREAGADASAAGDARGGGAPDGIAALAPGDALRGVTAVRGIAVGPARWSRPVELDLDADTVGTPDQEASRLTAALAAVRGDLAATAAKLKGGEAEIFEAQALLLDDAALLDPARAAIAAGASAAKAFDAAASEAAAALAALDDEYLRARAVDIHDVSQRVVTRLLGAKEAGAPEQPGIVVADLLTPGAVAQLDPKVAHGIATARGGTLDHAAIVAGALGIPLVVGLGPALLTVAEGTPLAVDADNATVLVDPPDTHALEARKDEADKAKAEALANAAATIPGIEVFANIGNAEEARLAVTQGAEGVGLLRTEFLFLDRRTPPTEDEQVATLTEIAEALQGRPLIVRTLDAGADKPVAFLATEPEANPFLGVRGLRLSLKQPDIFITQLNAIKRVAKAHPIKVMFPMVSTAEELQQARELLGPTDFEVGAMIEVPAAALNAGQLAPHLDFFSIGTNDLSQYTMAAERGNPSLAPLLQQALEPVLTLIAIVTQAAQRHGKWVGVCGELAGDPAAAARLVALGVTELSMAPGRIPAVKAHLRDHPAR
jgi:phosphoenolpyruvate-protein phosphotransferase/dihydroxyacetone kinase phosphotransfer subunit